MNRIFLKKAFSLKHERGRRVTFAPNRAILSCGSGLWWPQKRGCLGHQTRWAIGLGPIGLGPIGLGQIAQRLGDLVLTAATPFLAFLAFWTDLGRAEFAIAISI